MLEENDYGGPNGFDSIYEFIRDKQTPSHIGVPRYVASEEYETDEIMFANLTAENERLKAKLRVNDDRMKHMQESAMEQREHIQSMMQIEVMEPTQLGSEERSERRMNQMRESAMERREHFQSMMHMKAGEPIQVSK